jgi:multidrug efflux pump subunit AcrA (membrane-fusion protein)
MVASTIPDALVIPATALLTAQDGGTSVMLVGPDSHAHKTNVRVGVRQDEQVQIIEGLKADDKIVASGAYGLPDNAKIAVESADAK